MKNVIVFAVDSERYAIELRWVREIFTLGPVTPVPGAPVHVVGAINMRGVITPVLDLSWLSRLSRVGGEERGQRPSTRAGDGAALIDVEGVSLALRMAKVDEISTAEQVAGPPGDGEPGVIAAMLVDSQGNQVGLVDPPALVRLTLTMAHGHRGPNPAGAGSTEADHELP